MFMNYANDRIRTVLLAGHAGSGKTSLAEAMLYLTKGTDRLGRVEDGNTVCDYDPEEVRRRSSLSLALAPVEFDGVKINLIDTPGLFDFEAGLYEGLPAAESVLVTVSARSGLSVGARKAYKLAVKNNKARMFYISKVDADNADFYKVFEELKSGKSLGLPKWMEFDNKTLTGKIVELPTREDIDPSIEEHLIVELYSK